MYQQGTFTPGFGSPIGAEQSWLQQQYGPAGMNPFQSPQVQQLVSQIQQIVQQAILPQVVGLAVQQIQQQVTQLVAQQLATQQFSGQQPYAGQSYTGQQPFTGQFSSPWTQTTGAQNPLAGVLSQSGRAYAGLS
jgi:hypothetical protein